MVRVENACSSASFAFKEAWMAVASGCYEMVIAMGIEKMSGANTEKTLKAMAANSDYELEGSMGLTFPGVFAMIARRHMKQYGTTMEQMAKVAVKNHRNGALNPKSQFQMNQTPSIRIQIFVHCNLFDIGCLSFGASSFLTASLKTFPRSL